jgi:hypothetical protein
VTFGPGEDSEFQLDGSERGSERDLEPDSETEAPAADELQAEAEEEYHTALPPKVEAWRKRSAAGAILTGFALGLQEALETKRQEPSIVVQTSGDPPRDLPIEADFEYGRPRQTVVSIRPWLLDAGAAQQDSDETGPSGHGDDFSAGDGEAGPGEP